MFHAFRDGLMLGICRKLGRRGGKAKTIGAPRFHVSMGPKEVLETLNEFDGTHLVHMKVRRCGECL